MTTAREDETLLKLRELILYVCAKCEHDPAFDNEKLCALLFEIDRRSFILTGKTITGTGYIKADRLQ